MDGQRVLQMQHNINHLLNIA